ncbi:helix-turn-helix domain-containing protein [Nesterenkonia pannonica]|uniref:helix-turn-helix domain-containing protein n=1 Tax=Nesterenkonia pannonica TaxID=1548602 RepID=UPI0021646C1E|nr:helix-turn-helix domain-containing protein [Nesterenkonia pannonica]
MRTRGVRDPQRVQVIERAFGLLEALRQRQGAATARELKEASGLAGPTVHRLLHTLVGLGMVHQLPDRRYALGANLVPLGRERPVSWADWQCHRCSRWWASSARA